jgi:hypothetical protein
MGATGQIHSETIPQSSPASGDGAADGASRALDEL